MRFLRSVQGRLFGITLQRPPSEVTLLRKTLWLLPDNDMGLMVFTGSVPLTHLLMSLSIRCWWDWMTPIRYVSWNITNRSIKVAALKVLRV